MSHYHIVGVAGAGMSAIAHLLLDQGHTVSGSDLAANRATAALAARGARIWQGHAAAYVAGADMVLATAAVRADHVELQAAAARGTPRISRADLWRAWSADRPVLAVAGTHGKTTTSAMAALALRGAGIACGFLIGAEVADLGGSASWGDPAAPLVIEADEYGRDFLALTPDVAIITNVEWDHPDIYASPADYTAAFAAFAGQARDPRRVLICADDPGAAALDLPTAQLYGVDEQIARDPVSCRLAPLDWTASGLAAADGQQSFAIWHYDRRRLARRMLLDQSLAVPGAHNVRNALAALAAAALCGADLTTAAAALAGYGGSARRFELRGEARGVTVVDDYAHHPTEVRATLAAARQRYPGRRLVAYLQPHTFSRTEALMADWPAACAGADLLLVGDVYAAREHGDAGGLAADLAMHIAAAGVDARYAGPPAAAAGALGGLVRAGDVVLTLGAGDSETVAGALLAALAAGSAGGGR